MSQSNERRARELLGALGLTRSLIQQQGEGKVALVVEALEEAEARGAVKWRPVSEEPPKPGNYLVRAYGNHFEAGWENLGDGWRVLHPDRDLDDRITHWAPLLPPPSEEKR